MLNYWEEQKVWRSNAFLRGDIHVSSGRQKPIEVSNAFWWIPRRAWPRQGPPPDLKSQTNELTPKKPGF